MIELAVKILEKGKLLKDVGKASFKDDDYERMMVEIIRIVEEFSETNALKIASEFHAIEDCTRLAIKLNNFAPLHDSISSVKIVSLGKFKEYYERSMRWIIQTHKEMKE